MEKLNELSELAKLATPGKWWIDSHGQGMVAFSGEDGVQLVFATNNTMGPLVRHEDTGNLSHWRNDNDATFIAAANPETILAIAEAFRALEQRAGAAEAKLAELEKQNPKLEYIRRLETELAQLRARPAHAADLTELAPSEWGERAYDDKDIGYESGWNDCRAGMLRNIEEAK